jgi:hypothetical protein
MLTVFFADDNNRVCLSLDEHPTVYAATIEDEARSFKVVSIFSQMQEDHYEPEEAEAINALACLETIKRDHSKVARFLFEQREVPYGIFDPKTKNTYLHYAVLAGARKCCKLLAHNAPDLLSLANADGKTPCALYQERYGTKSAPSSPIGSPRAETDSPTSQPKRKRRGSLTNKLKEMREAFHSTPNLRNSPQITKLTSSTEGIKEGTKKGGI